MMLTRCVILTAMLLAASAVNAVGPSHEGKVTRAQFTRGIDQREPVDDIHYLPDDAREVFYFSEVLSLTGHKVFHRWEHNGNVLQNTGFDVGGPRWRVFSRQAVEPSQIGRWTVVVTDEDGWPLEASMLMYGAESMYTYIVESEPAAESSENGTGDAQETQVGNPNADSANQSETTTPSGAQGNSQ